MCIKTVCANKYYNISYYELRKIKIRHNHLNNFMSKTYKLLHTLKE